MGGLRHDDDQLLTQRCCMFDGPLEVRICVFVFFSFFFSTSPNGKLIWFMKHRKMKLYVFACQLRPSCSLILSMNILNITLIYSSWPCVGLLGEGGCGDSCTSGLVFDSLDSGWESIFLYSFISGFSNIFMTSFSWVQTQVWSCWDRLLPKRGFCLNRWRGEEKVVYVIRSVAGG